MSDYEETSRLVTASRGRPGEVHGISESGGTITDRSSSRRLLSVKLHYFTFFGGWGCLLPFLTLYYRYIGLSARQNGVVQSVRPFVNFLATPLWGVVGERFGGVKVIWIVSLVLQVILTCLIVLVKPDTDVANLERACYCGNQSNLSESLTYGDSHVPSQFAASVQKNDTFVLLCQRVKQDSLDARNIKLLEIAGLVAVGEFFSAPGPPLTDYFTLEILGNKRQGDYGKQRVWGTIGWGLASFAVGFSSEEGLGSSLCSPNFSLYFYLFGGFTTLSVIFALVIGIDYRDGHNDTKQQQVSFWVRLRTLLKHPRVFLFLVSAWVIGMLMSVIENFLFWFIQDLDGGQTIMGLSILVMSVGEIPAFVLSGYLIARIGYTATLCLTFVCYGVRFVGYSFLTNPWIVLPIELLHGVTFALRSAALVSYARAVAPGGLEAAAQTLFEGVLTGLGGGCGGILGGLSWQHLGARLTFRISAAVAAGTLVLFLIGEMLISAACPPSKQNDSNEVNHGGSVQ